ncbi:PAS domain S-box protein [Synechococcus sp. PCC 7336]|uniref:PAS domain S-box protein n=1 Tax=Synechococcus sp. PCC 7336 TaxID=195250 RepID=UPI00034B962A|nr:PAS domain S-box protein [Synechococcus sp. PCC 7336]
MTLSQTDPTSSAKEPAEAQPSPVSQPEIDLPFRFIFERASDPIFIIEPQRDRILDANARASGMLGYSRRELIEKIAISDIHPDEMPELMLFSQRVASQGQAQTDELSCLTRAGLKLPALISACAIEIDGRPCLLSHVRNDARLEGLPQSSEPSQTSPAQPIADLKFQHIFQHASDAIFIVDSHSNRIVDANPTACQMLGYSRQELIEEVSISDIHPDEMPALMAFGQRVMAEGLAQTNELSCLTRSGAKLSADMAACAIDIEGQPHLLVHVSNGASQPQELSICESMQLARLSLAVSEALVQGGTLHEILSSCTEAMVQHLDGCLARIWLLNEANNMLELMASSGMANSLESNYCSIPLGKQKIGTIAQSQQPFLTNQLLDDPEFGDRDWAQREGIVALAGYPLVVSDRLVGTIALFGRQQLTDATLQAMASIANGIALGIDRKQAEAELRQSEEQLRQLAENMHQTFWMYDRDGTPLYVSPAFETIWGIPCQQWYNDPQVWQRSLYPEDRLEGGLEQLLNSNPNASVREYRILRPDGSTRIIRDQSFPIRSEAGEVERLAGIAEDITERKQSEQVAIEALEQLAEIGELAATIVHEVRNPLTTVLMGLASFQQMELSERAQLRLSMAMEEAERLQRLLNEILLYAKPQSQQQELVELNIFLQEMLEPLQVIPAARDRHFEWVLSPEPVLVRGDRDKLKQVFINLVTNAFEATPVGGEVHWTIEPRPAEDKVCVAVYNTGDPIPADVLPEITKPFLTTKPEGNGLGLAIVKRLVANHGGELEIVSSKALGGTRVAVTLPTVE